MGQGESERVTGWLRDSILDGERAPGSRLIERDLASECGASRVPVRDALKALEGEGLIVLRPNTWAIVREFTEEDIRHLDEIRSVLEPLVFRLAAERRDADGLAELEGALKAERDAAERSDAVTARRRAADFHELASHLGGNPLLDGMMRTVGSQMRWVLSQHDDLVHVTDHHAELLEAIADGDPARAEAVATQHVRLGEQWRHDRSS